MQGPYSDGQGNGHSGKLKTHDHQLYLDINGIKLSRSKHGIRRQTASASVCIKPFCTNFTGLHSGENSIILWKSYRPIWITAYYNTEKKKPDSSTNQTRPAIKTEMTARESLNYHASSYLTHIFINNSPINFLEQE